MIRILWKKDVPKGEEHQEGRALLRELLGQEPIIEKGPYGKPYLKEGPFFSISHSGGWVALAIGEQELGLDLEAPRAINHKGFIGPEEEGIEPLTLWVVKESFMKYTGEGIRQFRSVRAKQIEENLYRVTDGMKTAYAKTFRIEECIGAVTQEKQDIIKEEQFTE